MYRIGIDGHMIGDHSGGNESYYTNILQNMNIPNDISIYLFLSKDVDDSVYRKKFIIVRFQSQNAFIRNFIELPKLCKRYHLNILHTQYFIPFYRPCKIVCTIHDICFEHFTDIFTKKEYFRQKILIPYAAHKSEKIFTVSKYSKGDIAKHYNISDSKIIVTYNAVNSEFKPLEKATRKKVRTKYGIKNHKYVLSVCNLQPRKNLVRLIRAFRMMKEEKPGKEQLVIVGKKAWMFNDILKEALGNSNDIIFTDYVPEEDLIRLYNDASCFIYPSYFEGFGIPPLEAMACGTPVAVANATSLPEVVGDAGLYFDPYNETEIKDTIKVLLSDEELCRILREKGLKRAHEFKWEVSSKKIINTYLQLL